MPTMHVLTVTPTLPHRVLDRVMTAVEGALNDCDASRVWISNELPRLAVMADLPEDDT